MKDIIKYPKVIQALEQKCWSKVFGCSLLRNKGQITAKTVKLQLHDAIYRLQFYSNSLTHILLFSNSNNNVASLQKNRGDKSHRVIVALQSVSWSLAEFRHNKIVQLLRENCFNVCRQLQRKVTSRKHDV